jgi:penicillin-binding protein 2
MKKKKFLNLVSYLDHIHSQKKTFPHATGDEIREFRLRDHPPHIVTASKVKKATIWWAIICVCAIISITRLAELQLVQGSNYIIRAEKNRIARKPILAPRGVIKDESNKLLAFNAPYITKDNRLQEYSTTDNLTQASEILAIRKYPCGEACAHLVGYTSQITETELQNEVLNNSLPSPITPKDERGRTGIESGYDRMLRGQNGFIEYEISASGEILGESSISLAHPGNSLVTYLDLELQQFIYQKLQQKVQEVNSPSGSVVVMDPHTGAVKALVTYPSYDNNIFALRQDTQRTNELLNDPRTPLLNRSISGTYPPGSTYKLVSGTAVLEEKILDREQTITDTGKIELSGITFNNWYYTSLGKTDGEVNIVKALARSNDIFFYKTSLDLGIDRLEKWTRHFGMGAVTGIDVPAEAKGLVPNPRWKEELLREQWYPGNTINMSIGQGDLLATPLQVATATSVIANKGTLVVPQLVKEIQDEQGQVICQRDASSRKWIEERCVYLNSQFPAPRQIPISSPTLAAIEEGMVQANQPGGTAPAFYGYTISTAGKTGTSETGGDRPPHAWYTVYAPLQKPEVVITVLVEFGGQGSSVAAPVAKDILDYLYF